MAPDSAIVEMKAVSKRYRQGATAVQVLKQLDFVLRPAQSVAIMGPSGSGKSTFLNMITGLDVPDEGSVLVRGMRVDSKKSGERASLRSRYLGIVFQQASLLPEMTARRNVEVPLLLWRCSAEEAKRRALVALDLVGLANAADRKPGELSVGQQQRVAIARAIVTDPELLICDEPTASLDALATHEILNLIRTLCTSLKKSCVIVTHDPQVVSYVDRHLRLEAGKLHDAALPLSK